MPNRSLFVMLLAIVKNRRLSPIWALPLCLLTQAASAQEALSAQDAVKLAIERSPAVKAAQSRLEAAAAGAKGAGAPFNPQGELAPGVGFTNGNALLSQQIDIGGRISAQRRAAIGLREAAAADLDLARLKAAAEARVAYYDLSRARQVEAAAVETTRLATQIRELVRKRVEIGEAPTVQVTRADIEVARAQQEVARAAGDVRARLAALNLLLGREAGTPLTASETMAVPPSPAEAATLVHTAQGTRPELAASHGLIRARQGDVQVAQSKRRPELFAEFASDVWSLDRDRFNTRNLGLQARLSFPLFDRGSLRAEVDRARAGVREQEAELELRRRSIAVEVERAAAELTAARQIALNYQDTILPQSRQLLQATQNGFDIGLSTFLDVLEAQRVVRQTQTEYLTALFEAVRSGIALDTALGTAPGLEFTASPQPQPEGKKKR